MTAVMSVARTEKVPPAPATEIDFAPLGRSVTVLVPALTVPENATSLAVIEIGELVAEI